MPAHPPKLIPVGPVLLGRAEREKANRKRRGIVLSRTPAGPRSGSGRWTALDLLSTLATVLFLFSVTGYANATPLGTVEDTLDAFFEEVWDSADEATIDSQRSMIDMVRSAHEDARAYAASGRRGNSRTSDLPASFMDDDWTTPTPMPRATARPAGQAAPTQPALSGPVLTTGSRGPSVPLSVRATPTETVPPTPTRRVVISTGLGGPSSQDRRTNGSSGPPAPPTTAPSLAPVGPVVRAIGTIAPTQGATQAPLGLPTLGVPTAEATAATPEPTVATTPTTAPLTPTSVPTTAPTVEPTQTAIPTTVPTTAPTTAPTDTAVPTMPPTAVPTETTVPTVPPTATPTQTAAPTSTPTPSPTATPTATATPTSVAGSVVIRTDAPATGLYTVTNMRPAACATQSVNVFNAGRLPFQSYTLTTSAAGTATVLWTDSASGLQLQVRRGSTVLYSGPIAVTDVDLALAMQPGDTDTLELSICLPASAGNAFQGQTQTITVTWTATGS